LPTAAKVQLQAPENGSRTRQRDGNLPYLLIGADGVVPGFCGFKTCIHGGFL
jgi:hypothetical protein